MGPGLAGPLARIIYLSQSGVFHLKFTVRSISTQMSQIQGLSILFIMWQNKIFIVYKEKVCLTKT